MSIVKPHLIKNLSLLGLIALAENTVWAAEAAKIDTAFIVHNLWILIAAALVFIMHLGFATLEGGAVQAKNRINILFKNTAIIAIGLLTYALMGFNLMYPGDAFAGGFFGFAGFGVAPGADGLTSAYNPAYTYWSDFIFQAMFAATAGTILSGAVAERIKLGPFLVFTTIFLAVIYPVIGMWKWGGGFLDKLGTPFYDFAGSTIVHGVGGWAALAGAMILGPRLGKYVNGKAQDIHPSSVSLMTIGVFLLWLGWFGFNGGSVLSADPAAVSLVFVTTTLAGAAGIFGAILVAKILTKKLDVLMALNGALAGLVSITAGADQMGALDSIIIGFIGGGLVVVATKFFEKVKIDDPVGAIPVHLVCGIWGTLAVGLFGGLASGAQVMSQLIGIVSVGVFAFGSSYAMFFVLDKVMGLRVSKQQEIDGLDIHEHSLIEIFDSENEAKTGAEATAGI